MNKPWKLGTDSASKLIVWFQDGNIRTFYSLDWRSPHSKHKNPGLGIRRLHNLALRYLPYMQQAILYDQESGQEICRYPATGSATQLHRGYEK